MPDGNLRSRLRNFVLELKRRKVIRASIAYVVVGAGVAEGAQLFLPALGAPEWVPKTVALIVVLGFPVAMAALEHLAGLRRTLDRTDAHWLYRRSLAIAIELENKEAEARLRNSLAVFARQGGELEEAEKQYRKAAALIRRDQYRDELGVVLNGLGAVLIKQNQASEARKILSEALASNREFEQAGAEADSLAALGAAARTAGDLADTSTWYQQCVERRRELGDRAGEGWALQRLGEVSREAGEVPQADAFAAAALAVGRETGDKSLVSLVSLASELQSPDSKSSTD